MRIDAMSGDEREQLKEEIRSDLRKEERRRRAWGCLFSSLLTMVVVFGPIVWAGMLAAKTGFVDVPVLSSRVYEPGEPVRPVQPLAGTTAEQLAGIIGSRAKYDPRTEKATLRITEQELTTLVAEGLRNAPPGAVPFPVSHAQVAVDGNVLEFYMVSPQEERDATVLVRIIPEIRNGELTAAVESVKIGALEMPKALAEMAFTAVGSAAMAAVRDAVSQAGALTAVTLEEKALSFVIAVRAR